MSDGVSEAQAMQGPNILCPEVVRPGQTGCKFSDLEGRVDKIDRSINSEDEKEPGLRYLYIKDKAAREQRAKDIKVLLQIAAALIGSLGAVTGWAMNRLWTVVEPPAAAIIQDYWSHHPETKVPHSYVVQPEGFLGTQNQPQGAGDRSIVPPKPM